MKRLILFLSLLNFAAQAQEKIEWPGDKKAAIVLTYDDALQSQLDIAVPQLDAAHLKATFFLTGDIDKQTIPKWRALSKKGHELGNHTIYHPCASGNDNPVISDNYTVYEMIREIDVMNHFLYAVDGKTTRTYAYPCTETTVGNGKSYVDTLRKYGLVKYARVGGDMDAVITNFKNLDLLQIPSYGIEDNATGTKLIAFVKRVEQSGGMGILMLHGVGGDYLTISADAHRELLDYLKKNKKNIWVTTFQQAMDYATNVDKAK
ncbi:polysaccharide deacetylase family protein [Mucilaginibacter sp. McL0603]|uniref:polysaccharide deacetylase family protein n=1 Tax=Mucilaginibacter sp. McL0603 TaxID=3415670 RepID=UPI003CEF9367